MDNYSMAKSLYESISSSALHGMVINLIKAAVRYSGLRNKWYLASAEERIDLDRKRSHDAFISSCDILARNMSERREDASWRSKLGNDRKTIGDFACYISLFVGLDAR
ncbi:MAG: hypothetical protein IH591_03205 [Bacteroidales bacterium]|nr:hypothetical protein [Bacteroidales bacterium]